jgi:hypothetical protein
MNNFEKKKLEMDFKNFTSRNFERPNDCKNLAQVRFYVSELCGKIEEFEKRFNDVPTWAYSLLSQYNAKQNSMVHIEFVKIYS